MIHIPSLKRKFFILFVLFFFVYISIYGTLSVFLDNILVRSIKDFLLITLVAFSFVVIIIRKPTRFNAIIMFALFCLVIIGSLGLTQSNDFWIHLLYGIKISVIPIGALFFGMYLKYKGVDITKVVKFVFPTLVLTWLTQYFLGIPELIRMGFEYEVNIKHFFGFPRLPSLAGTPDNYAFLLAITGLLLEDSLVAEGKKKRAFVIKLVTFVFLLLATVRSALLLWFVCQMVMLIKQITAPRGRQAYLLVAGTCFFIALAPLLIVTVVADTSIASVTSTVDRFSHWGTSAPSLTEAEGIVGRGWGVVGSASQRIFDLGYEYSDYAVDNQYLAFYEQVGWFGLSLVIVILLSITMTLRRKSKMNKAGAERPIVAYGLILGTLVSCFFTNTLEIYPFNVFLWVNLGMKLY